MDTSETYIRMCEKATEIQALMPTDAEHETWYLSPKYNLDFNEQDTTSASDAKKPEFEKGKVYTFADYYAFGRDYWNDGTETIELNQFIWLPRQGQLQKLFGDYDKVRFEVLNFTKWFEGEMRAFSSMEQAWLAYYIHKVHNKIWNGEDWIKQGRKNWVEP